MSVPLHIVFRNAPPSEALEAEVRKRAEKFEQYSNHLMRCAVTIDVDGKHKQQGRLYDVRIELTVPGKDIVVSHFHRHEDVYVVVRDAFDAASRRLQDHMRCLHGDVKTHAMPSHGQVTKLFADGYGFIESPDGREFYFDWDSVAAPHFARLEVGTEVQFLESAAGDGLQAKRVSIKHPTSH